ncbi:hypothetical protein B296_00006629 [Ensete ventricosum]|uniref:Uncharacterized protein n=1 Tax=Ensete ventricosum TaxID=4639 RepID=A0A427AGU3_ENSVE|nr:hypothetical protein B296_00006629 [Ensete ventricosum]
MIPLLRRGAGAFIVSVVGHSYLISLLPLLLTMLSYLSTTLVVLAVRRAPAGEGCRPYLGGSGTDRTERSSGEELVGLHQMDLNELRGMPKVSNGKAPRTRTATREVGSSPAREAPKASSKRPVDAPVKWDKKIKVLTRRHKSRLNEGESRSRSKGKEPATPSEEPDTLVESEEGGTSPVHRRPRLMKDLFKTKVQKDDVMEGAEELDEGLERLVGSGGVRKGTSPPPTGAGALHAPSEVLLARAAKEMVLMVLFDLVHDTGRLITFMDYRIKQLQEELDALRSDGGPEAVAKTEERAFELQEELEKTRRERDEVLLRREALEKELYEVQRLLKEARVRARKMDDELLQAAKELESARAELPKQTIVQYNELLGFKEGLKMMGRVTYEYGYRVTLARFHARHPDAEVEEDPFTIHPEDDLVPMERQQAFDDSVPPEP